MSRRNHPKALRERIFQHLETLRISLPENEFDQLLSAADKENISRLEFLDRVLGGPANRRRERSIERRIRTANFRDSTTLESFDWKFNAPVRPGDTITGTVEVTAVREDKPITTLATKVTRQDGVVVLEGTAVCYTMALGA